MKTLGALTAEARRQAGQDLNRLKDEVEQALETAKASLESNLKEGRLARERVDITLPGRIPPYGRRHPLTAAREDLEDIFLAMGYEIFDGPEVEDDYHCFEALNMPPDHPARDMQDTFYLAEGGLLLRTHTSSGQIRYMLNNPHPPDVRIICPGKVYRRDDDITHSPMFQQIEGWWSARGSPSATSRGPSRPSSMRSSARSSRCASARRISRTPSPRSRWTSGAWCAAARAAASASRRDGSRSWARAWCTPRSSRP
jgi:phenylalanyl-tRNA synthetase alpha chain